MGSSIMNYCIGPPFREAELSGATFPPTLLFRPKNQMVDVLDISVLRSTRRSPIRLHRVDEIER